MATRPLYKAIVVGTDGSDRADLAVRTALGLAKATGATLHAVYVVHGAWAAFESAEEQRELEARREHNAQVRARLLEEAAEAGVAVEVHTPAGHPADAILHLASSLPADLIVVGNRGMTGAKRFVLGSVPNKIAHGARCAVLIVKTDEAGASV